MHTQKRSHEHTPSHANVSSLQVTLEQLQQFASESCYHEISARTNANVTAAFVQLLTVAGLPVKTCLSVHRLRQHNSSFSDRSSMFRRRTNIAECGGALIPNVPRPEVQSELLQHLRRQCVVVERPHPTNEVVASCCKCDLM